MRYRVTFAKRFQRSGEASESLDPTAFLWPPEGVVLDKVLVSREQPMAQHNQEVLDEDDGFLGRAAEIWEFEIADDRQEEFIAALENSETVMEYQVIDDLNISTA